MKTATCVVAGSTGVAALLVVGAAGELPIVLAFGAGAVPESEPPKS